MEFYEVVNARHSVRKYMPDEVPMDAVLRILDAARNAPSWANKQGVRYVVVRDPERVSGLVKAINQGWVRSAPMFIVAISTENWSGSHHGLSYFMLDAGIAVENLVLAATAEGLGTCWMGVYDEKKIQQLLKIPKEMHIVAITPLGYPNEGNPRERDRLPLKEIAFLDEYGNKFVEL